MNTTMEAITVPNKCPDCGDEIGKTAVIHTTQVCHESKIVNLKFRCNRAYDYLSKISEDDCEWYPHTTMNKIESVMKMLDLDEPNQK